MREIIKEARNVEEAIKLACQELGVDRDKTEFEIISLPKRGFLGLRNTPAKVRVYVEEPEQPKPAPRKPEPRPVVQPPKQQEPRREQPKPAAPRQEQKPAPAPMAKPEQKAAPAPAPAPRPEAPKKEFTPSTPISELKFVSAETVDGKARTAADYVREVLAEMGVAAEISVAYTDNGIILRLSGDGLGVIIGRRGETLDSLQYLAGLVGNRQEGDYMRVTIDSGNYREKRERTLEQLAQKLSASAIRYGRPSTLEPMNPYERRIIHATVSQIDGVTSTSIGEEPNRRVVINPANARPQQNRPNNRGGKPSGNRPPYNGNRPPRRNDVRPVDAEKVEGKPEGKPEARPEGRPEFRSNDRPPRRENRDRPPFNRDGAPRPPATRPTPTNIDREYAREIEREAPAFVKPDPSEKPATVRENTAPTRTQTKSEGDDLPLYGKIEL